MRATAIVALVVVTACRPEYGLQSVDPAAPGADSLTPTPDAARDPQPDPSGQQGAVPADPVPRWEPVEQRQARGAAVQVLEDRGRNLRQEIFELGGDARTPVTDFLFVVDGSVSMEHVIGRVQAGVEAMADDGLFPARSRVAVTGTTPTDPRTRWGVHPAVASKGLVTFEPGLGGLVDAERLQRAHSIGALADHFGLPGCEAWFEPSATASDGTPCLVAHTQTAALYTRVEAGLTVTGQLLARGGLFRPGAAANVIIVSDTHDPGANPDNPDVEELLAARPTGEDLAALAGATHDLASFRVHAIAPAGDCGEPWFEEVGPAYFDAAQATSGETLDLCTARPEHYQALIRRIAERGSVPTAPVLALGRPADVVTAVRVDGRPVGFVTVASGEAVRLTGSLPSARSRVEIEFTPAAPARR
jgi:hypothetical protein